MGLYFFLNSITLAVYEVQINDHAKPVPFTHLGSFPMAEGTAIRHFKIIGDRVLADLEHRVVVWDLVSRRYYSIRVWSTNSDLALVRGNSHIHIDYWLMIIDSHLFALSEISFCRSVTNGLRTYVCGNFQIRRNLGFGTLHPPAQQRSLI